MYAEQAMAPIRNSMPGGGAEPPVEPTDDIPPTGNHQSPDANVHPDLAWTIYVMVEYLFLGSLSSLL